MNVIQLTKKSFFFLESRRGVKLLIASCAFGKERTAKGDDFYRVNSDYMRMMM